MALQKAGKCRRKGISRGGVGRVPVKPEKEGVGGRVRSTIGGKEPKIRKGSTGGTLSLGIPITPWECSRVTFASAKATTTSEKHKIKEKKREN